MSTKRNNKRKRKGPMIDGEIDSALTVTPKTISETKEDGTTVTKQIWVSLDKPQVTQRRATVVEEQADIPAVGYDPDDIPSPQQEGTRTYQVRINILSNSNSISLIYYRLDTKGLYTAIHGPNGRILGRPDKPGGHAGECRYLPAL
jgi:hypothetical protein